VGHEAAEPNARRIVARVPLVQSAAFVVRDGRVRIAVAPGGTEPLRCASLLKPLLFWAGADAGVFADRDGWARDAAAAVARSANDPTVALWEACGGERLLARLAERTRRSWTLEPGGARSFGRVLITAADAAAGYAALARARPAAGATMSPRTCSRGCAACRSARRSARAARRPSNSVCPPARSR
jgi:hypothetical protein